MRNLILQLEESVLRRFVELGCHGNSNGYDWWAASSRVFAPEDREVAKAVMRNLVAKGEAAVGRGLVNEDDGMMAGSGWYITKKGMERIEGAIRALPLPGQPKEGAPPFQASTLDDLLSVATDDEADAIRACAERLAETEGGA